jgi:hypothetical protein
MSEPAPWRHICPREKKQKNEEKQKILQKKM